MPALHQVWQIHIPGDALMLHNSNWCESFESNMTYWLVHSSCFVYNIAINYLWNCCLYWLLIKRYMICLIILAKVSFQDDHLHKLFLFSGSLFWVSLYAYIAKKEFLKVWLGKSTFSLKALLYFFANNESPFYKRFYCLIFLKKKKPYVRRYLWSSFSFL